MPTPRFFLHKLQVLTWENMVYYICAPMYITECTSTCNLCMCPHVNAHPTMQLRAICEGMVNTLIPFTCTYYNYFPRCEILQQILQEDTHLKQPWQNAIRWLQNEMERVSARDSMSIHCGSTWVSTRVHDSTCIYNYVNTMRQQATWSYLHNTAN